MESDSPFPSGDIIKKNKGQASIPSRIAIVEESEEGLKECLAKVLEVWKENRRSVVPQWGDEERKS